jgi:poly(hydroxyalkanoate) depolymerase family esterase
MPVMVMLHGCTQNPDDFARGTRMNALAEEKQCFVVYPAQTQSANSSKCWNWFKAVDQQRDQGEPSIIAGITRQVISDYKLDSKHVYVAGLSSGGAMAIIMGTTYPDLYAAVGVHSGLPYGAARDLPSAFSAMRGAKANKTRTANTRLNAIPIIVFHGDRDTTVHASNADQLMQQNVPNDRTHASAASDHINPDVIVQEGKVPNGHAYTRTSHHDEDGNTVAEHWVIHGAGHAWAGGSRSGSYTDAKGPDASGEMMRFFFTQAKEE